MKNYKLLALLLGCGGLLFLASCYLGSSVMYFDKDAAGKPNLVTNGSFETRLENDPKMPLGWLSLSLHKGGAKQDVRIDSLEAYHGFHSLAVKNPQDYSSIISDAFKIDPKGGYYIDLQVKAIKPCSMPVVLQLITYDVNGNRCSVHKSSHKPTEVWKRIAVSAAFLKSKARFARISITIPSESDNTIYLDSVGCYKVHQFDFERN